MFNGTLICYVYRKEVMNGLTYIKVNETQKKSLKLDIFTLITPLSYSFRRNSICSERKEEVLLLISIAHA